MKTKKNARGSEDPEAARLSWQLERRFQVAFGRFRKPRGRSNCLGGLEEEKTFPGPCLTRRGPWGPGATVPGERQSWEDSGALRRSGLGPPQSPPRGAQDAERARGDYGDAWELCDPRSLGKRRAGAARGEAAA